MTFSIIWRVRHSPEYPGVIELTVNEPAAMALVLAMSKEHYSSSCGTLASLASGITESTLGTLLSSISGIKRNSNEGRTFRERAHGILKEMVGEGHLAGRVPPKMNKSQEDGVDLISVDLTPLELSAFAVDCEDTMDRVPRSTADLMRHIAGEADAILTSAQKMAAALSEDEPVNHDRSQ
jgi:hypothetical protein